jgi:hypothetical protein
MFEHGLGVNDITLQKTGRNTYEGTWNHGYATTITSLRSIATNSTSVITTAHGGQWSVVQARRLPARL